VAVVVVKAVAIGHGEGVLTVLWMDRGQNVEWNGEHGGERGES
jgi:hypothetical protein